MGLTILLSLSSQPTVMLKWLIILRKYVSLINDESIIKAVLVSTNVNRKGCEQEGGVLIFNFVEFFMVQLH